MRKPLIVGIGELLVDVFPTGHAMGGAPANFLSHAASLGADACLISSVGDDPDGRFLLSELAARQIDNSGVFVSSSHATGRSLIQLDPEGVPFFTIPGGIAWDHLQADHFPEGIAQQADAICYGTLGQRSAASAAATRSLLQQTASDTLRVFDLNLRISPPPIELIIDSLSMADLVKLNEEELAVLSSHLALEGDVRLRISQLHHRYHLKVVACTFGPRGSLLYDGEQWSEHPGISGVIRDTVGAGDSFLATVTLGLLHRWALEDISTLANKIASYVCSQSGGAPVLPAHLKQFPEMVGQTVCNPVGP